MRRAWATRCARRTLLADSSATASGRAHSRVTTEAALGWATQPSAASPTWWATRLAVVRGFAAHLQTVEADTEVPPKGLLPSGASRARRICSPRRRSPR